MALKPITSTYGSVERSFITNHVAWSLENWISESIPHRIWEYGLILNPILSPLRPQITPDHTRWLWNLSYQICQCREEFHHKPCCLKSRKLNFGVHPILEYGTHVGPIFGQSVPYCTHNAHIGPRWDPYWSHILCYLGSGRPDHCSDMWSSGESVDRTIVLTTAVIYTLQSLVVIGTTAVIYTAVLCVHLEIQWSSGPLQWYTLQSLVVIRTTAVIYTAVLCGHSENQWSSGPLQYYSTSHPTPGISCILRQTTARWSNNWK